VFFPQVALVSVEEHLKVLSACEARDADAAEKMIVAHLSSAMSRSLGVSSV
jgi:DNA-binding GntR family transcriptional regulator